MILGFFEVMIGEDITIEETVKALEIKQDLVKPMILASVDQGLVAAVLQVLVALDLEKAKLLALVLLDSAMGTLLASASTAASSVIVAVLALEAKEDLEDQMSV